MHLWAIMHRARKAGAKIVTIDPFRCKTAERSDWWIPIRPGTDAALALGMMHVIWRDGLQDDDYLNRYCLGADQLRERALSEYLPIRWRRSPEFQRPTLNAWPSNTPLIPGLHPRQLRHATALWRRYGHANDHLFARHYRRLATFGRRGGS